jgi:hypothetical protein
MSDITAPLSPDAVSGNGGTDQGVSAPPEFVAKSDTTKSAAEANELLRADAGDVKATTVSMDRSGAESITAERVTMDHSGAKSLEAKSAQLTNSGAAFLKAERAVIQNGSAVFVSANEARLVKSSAVAVFAGNLTAEGDLKTLLHVGPSEGCIRPVFDAKSAVGLGAGFGLVVLVLGRLLRRLTS